MCIYLHYGRKVYQFALIAQLGERQTEVEVITRGDLNVTRSIRDYVDSERGEF